MNYGAVDNLIISDSRWHVDISFEKDGKRFDFVASADAFFTERDGIWFATAEETDEYAEQWG